MYTGYKNVAFSYSFAICEKRKKKKKKKKIATNINCSTFVKILSFDSVCHLS